MRIRQLGSFKQWQTNNNDDDFRCNRRILNKSDISIDGCSRFVQVFSDIHSAQLTDDHWIAVTEVNRRQNSRMKNESNTWT